MTAKIRSSGRGKARLAGFVCLVCFLLCALPVNVTAQRIQEYQIKSVFLYNLANFVSWPQTHTHTGFPFTIGIYGPDPFGPLLDQTVAEETKSGRPLLVKRMNSLEEIEGPLDIIFISEQAMNEWPKIRDMLDGRPVLTVADKREFTQSGGMVALLKQSRKIQVEVNHNQVRKANLTMSAKLLRLANLVE